MEFEKLRYAAAQARLPFDREAWLNLAFYLDSQYVEWATDARTIREIPRPKGQENLPRPIVNKVMHYVQQAHAEVLQDKPSADVLPASDEVIAIGAADLCKSYCDYVSEPVNANWDKQLARAALWGLLAGNGWLKWTWNPKLGRPDVIPPTFFEVFPDPYAKEFGRARYIIHSQFMDPEQVYELWGKDLPAGTTETVDPQRVTLLQGMGSAPVLNGVTVNEIWVKPSRRHPKGQYAVWSGTEQLVPPGDLPYEHLKLNGGMLPFTHIGCIERPDSMWYRAPVSYLRSAQMDAQQVPRPADHEPRVLRQPEVVGAGRARAGGAAQRQPAPDPARDQPERPAQARAHPGHGDASTTATATCSSSR
jgi:hypothetical protein